MQELIIQKLCIAKPDEYLLPKIKNYKDVLDNLVSLKNCSYSETLLERLLIIIHEKSNQTHRFRKKECFKLLKKFRKQENKPPKKNIVGMIFVLFSRYIMDISDENANDLSVALKDLPLSDNQIEWLLDNSDNLYVLNRILRYPECSKLISNWAEKQLKKNKSEDREAELIGRVLDFKQNYQTNSSEAFVWGIYYSRLSKKSKKYLLDQELKRSANDHAVEVAFRLGLIDLLEKTL